VRDLTPLVAPEGVADRTRGKLGDSLRIVAASERSQLRNRQAALRRLAMRLDAATRPPRPRTPTRRTASSVRKRLEAKGRRSHLKARRREPGDDDA
jgi:ribosome-associated protein